MKEILAYSFIAFGFLLAPLQTLAQYESVEEKYMSFVANEDTKFMINNKYGDLTFETWEKDSIGIKTTIRISSRKQESVNRILNSVIIDKVVFGNTVEVETSFADNASFIKSYLGKLDPFNSNELTIDYQINFPNGLEMEIANRFGNIMIEQTSSDIDINLDYGDLRLEDMTGDLHLKLKTGRLIGRKVKKVEIDGRNYGIRLKSAEYAILDIQQCDTKIDEVDFANVKLLGGELDIDEIHSIKGSASNADISIELAVKEIDLDLKNSSLMVEEFDENIKKVIIDEVSSTVDLNITNLSFTLEAEVEESQFSVPKTVSNVERVVTDERKEARTIHLTYDGGSASQSKFKFTGVRGSFFLIEE